MGLARHIVEHAILGTGSGGSSGGGTLCDEHVFVVSSGQISESLDFTPASKANLIVVEEGLTLCPEDYSLSGSMLFFGSGVLVPGETVLVKNLAVSASSGGGYEPDDETIELSDEETLTVKDGGISAAKFAAVVPSDEKVLGYAPGSGLIWRDVASSDISSLEPVELYVHTVTQSGEVECTLPYYPEAKERLIVSINGIYQHQSSYDIEENRLLLPSGLVPGDEIQVQAVAMIGAFRDLGASIVDAVPLVVNLSGELGSYDVELPLTPGHINRILVSRNGTVQAPGSYSLSGHILSFGTPFGSGEFVQVYGLRPSFIVKSGEIEGDLVQLYHDGFNGRVESLSGELVLASETGDIRAEERIWGAVYNDYADHWMIAEHTPLIPGCCYSESGRGLVLPEKRAEKGSVGILSDTFGFSVGDPNGTVPIAVSGFVLAYVDREYPPGTLLVSLPGGPLTKARWYEVLFKRPVAKYMKPEPSERIYRGIRTKGRSWVKVI